MTTAIAIYSLNFGANEKKVYPFFTRNALADLNATALMTYGNVNAAYVG